MKPVVGQKVFLKPVGNNARYDNKEIKEYIVKKVGRKYFEVWDGSWEYSAIRFHLEDLSQATIYSADWKLYFSMQDILNADERSNLIAHLRKTFDQWSRLSLTLDQLRRIDAITKEVTND